VFSDRRDDFEEPRRSGAGPMIFIAIAGILLCGGSLGVIGFFVWVMTRAANEREEAVVAEQSAREQAQRDQQAPKAKEDDDLSQERFERVARAMAEGLKAGDRLADSYTADGKPLLSWRVHLLPRLGEEKLYRKFKLDEPWNGPTNSMLTVPTPSVYKPARFMQLNGLPPTWTYIRGFSQEGAIFEPRAEYALKDMPAGPENTLAIVDSAEGVLWTKPDDWKWEPGRPRPKLGLLSSEQDWFLAASADGRVWRIRRDTPDDTLRLLLDRRHDRRAADLLSHVVPKE
jgi:hypothetical protein